MNIQFQISILPQKVNPREYLNRFYIRTKENHTLIVINCEIKFVKSVTLLTNQINKITQCKMLLKSKSQFELKSKI